MSSTTSRDLALVRDFVNTVNLEDGIDEIGTPAALQRWLTDAGLLPSGRRLTKADQVAAVAVREALRDLIGGQSEKSAGTRSRATLDEAAKRALLRLEFHPDGTASLISTAPGREGALGRVLAGAHSAMARGEWSRLKLCGREACRWAYVDGSKNRSRRWCSMESCGNREKGEAFRQRHRP